MRRIMIGFALVPLCAPMISAQTSVGSPDIDGTSTNARNEIGVNVLGLVHFDYDRLYPRPQGPRISFGNGISYQRWVGRGAFRFSMDLFRDAFEAGLGTRDGPKYFSATGTGMRTEVRFGYEHQFGSGRIKSYAAIDLVGGHERLRLNGEGWGDLAWQSEPEPYAYETSSVHYGIAPSVGLSWRLSKRFSCSMESSVLFVLINQEDNPPRGIHSKVYFDVLRSASVNYHFN